MSGRCCVTLKFSLRSKQKWLRARWQERLKAGQMEGGSAALAAGFMTALIKPSEENNRRCWVAGHCLWPSTGPFCFHSGRTEVQEDLESGASVNNVATTIGKLLASPLIHIPWCNAHLLAKTEPARTPPFTGLCSCLTVELGYMNNSSSFPTSLLRTRVCRCLHFYNISIVLYMAQSTYSFVIVEDREVGGKNTAQSWNCIPLLSG